MLQLRKRDPAAIHQIARRVPFYIVAMRSTLISGWCVPAAAARSGRCGRCGLTAVDRGQLSWRTGTEPICRNPPAATSCGGGGFFVCFEEVRVGECGWVQKVVL